MATDTPAVTVLLATYNGMPFLPEQVASILDQRDVDVELVVSDDQSIDGSWEWLQGLAANETGITLLPRVAPSGGYAANFYRLLRDVDVSRCELIAFSDQDDTWLPGKLAHQAALVRAGVCEAVSSNVTAVAPDGTRILIRKSYPQRRFDYLFEAPGPGSTFLFTRRLAEAVQGVLSECDVARSIQSHDWLVYAVCRSLGWQWRIEDMSWVDYRQHSGNALGANLGLRPALRRLAQVRTGWHRYEALKLATVTAAIAAPPARSDLELFRTLLSNRGLRSRRQLLTRVQDMRRRPRDRWLIGILIAAGLW